MFNKLKQLFRSTPAHDFRQLLKEGGIIIDVRSKAEYASGHIKGSNNIPLSDLKSGKAGIKDKNTPIITCCASGMRSASAKSMLRSQGFSEVYNGGGWRSLQTKVEN